MTTGPEGTPTPQYELKKDTQRESLSEEQKSALDVIQKNSSVLAALLDKKEDVATGTEKEKQDKQKVLNAYNMIKDLITTQNQTLTTNTEITNNKTDGSSTTEKTSEKINQGQDNGIIESMNAEALTDIATKISEGQSVAVIGRSDAHIFKDNGPNAKLVNDTHTTLFTELQKYLPTDKQILLTKKQNPQSGNEQIQSDWLNEVLAQARALQALKDIKTKIGETAFQTLMNNPTTNISTEPHKESRSGTDRGVSVICKGKDVIPPPTQNLTETKEKIKDVDHYHFTIPVRIDYVNNVGPATKWINFQKHVIVTNEKTVTTKVDEKGNKVTSTEQGNQIVTPLGSATQDKDGPNKDLRSPISAGKDLESTLAKINKHPVTYGRTSSSITDTYSYVENNQTKTKSIASTSNAPRAGIAFVLDPVVYSGIDKKTGNYIDINNFQGKSRKLDAEEGTGNGPQQQIQKDFPITNETQFNAMISQGKIIGNEKPSF